MNASAELTAIGMVVGIALVVCLTVSSCQVLVEKERTTRFATCLERTEQAEKCASLMGNPPGQ